jgi:hypothetical protein
MTTVGLTSVTITIAGRTISDAADYVIAYLEGRTAGTSQRIRDYDYDASLRRQAFAEGSSPFRITEGTIVSAIKLNGRLAYRQLADWYRPREEAINWNLVPSDCTFVMSDPSECDGAYDNLCAAWFNFLPLHVLGHKEFGVGATQINKILHQVLPNLVPIFDRKLFDLYFSGDYRDEAIMASQEVAASRLAARCESRFADGFKWEPLRRDMERITRSDFNMIREQVAERPCMNTLVLDGLPAQVWAAKNLSDVRLIDMIAWQL